MLSPRQSVDRSHFKYNISLDYWQYEGVFPN
jgi:hypothetical protein